MDERKSYAMGGPTPYCVAWETPAPPIDPPGCTTQKILRANSTTKIKSETGYPLNPPNYTQVSVKIRK